MKMEYKNKSHNVILNGLHPVAYDISPRFILRIQGFYAKLLYEDMFQ